LNEERVNILSSSKLSLKLLKLTDAIAFISNKNNNDTLVALKDVILFMQGKPQTTVKVWCLIIQILVPRVI
jgi:phosphate transport system substrate-binding protein